MCDASVFFHGLETDFISFIKLYIPFKGGVAWTDHFAGSALHQDSKVLAYSNTSEVYKVALKNGKVIKFKHCPHANVCLCIVPPKRRPVFVRRVALMPRAARRLLPG